MPGPASQAADADDGGKCDTCHATLVSGATCRRKATGEGLCTQHRRQRESCEECPVCLSAIAGTRGKATMQCGHAFHARCLRSWFARRALTCPMCRSTCWEGMALLGGRRLSPKLQALLRTAPPPLRAFFPTHIVSHLERDEVRRGLGVDEATVELVVDVACESFTRDIFFAKMRALGL